MKTWFLWQGDNYYPLKNNGNFMGSYESRVAALEAYANLEYKGDWYHIEDVKELVFGKD